jgi:hypothetical protein
MSANTPEQELLIQLETALHRLVESFWEEPYRYFTESDAVTALQSWVATRPALAQSYQAADEFATGLLHREYPTFFRLDDRNPMERKGPPYGRGHYDLAVLNPAFVRSHKADIVTNRRIRDGGAPPGPPLVAAVEFKLLVQRWKPDGDTLIRQDLGKLLLALEDPPDIGAAYMCVFWRDTASGPGPPDIYQAAMGGMLSEFPAIATVFAISWPQADRKAFVHYAGPWITEQPSRF